MLKRKNVLEVMQRYNGLIKFSDAEIAVVFRDFADVKCKTSKIEFIDYDKLCHYYYNPKKYQTIIIQDGKVILELSGMDLTKIATIIIIPRLGSNRLIRSAQVFRYNPKIH